MRSMHLAAAALAAVLFLAIPARASEGFLGSGNEVPTFGGGVGDVPTFGGGVGRASGTAQRTSTNGAGSRSAAFVTNETGTFGGGAGREDDNGQLGSGNIVYVAPGIGAGVGLLGEDLGQLGSGNLLVFDTGDMLIVFLQ
jgi:hypothetical protein